MPLWILVKLLSFGMINELYSILKPDDKLAIAEYYNLDVIISVGYRVKSIRGTQFRQWANTVLKEYLLKGYSVNQRLNRLEQLQQPYRRIPRLK